jgi:gamma-glutamyltranspeptidase
VAGLEAIGHTTSRFNVGGSSVTAIAKNKESITANADFRREAIIAGY